MRRRTAFLLCLFLLVCWQITCQKTDCLKAQGSIIVDSVQYDTLTSDTTQRALVYFDFIPADSQLKNQDTSECSKASRCAVFKSTNRSIKSVIDSIGISVGARFDAIWNRGACNNPDRYEIPAFRDAVSIAFWCMRQPN
jgi:hypothetical protein